MAIRVANDMDSIWIVYCMKDLFCVKECAGYLFKWCLQLLALEVDTGQKRGRDSLHMISTSWILDDNAYQKDMEGEE